MSVGVLCAVLLLQQAESRTDRATYRVDVEAVQVGVFASRNGSPLAGLTANDFLLRDNEVEQAIDRVDFRREPMSVALVLDASDSVTGTTLRRLKAAANAFLRDLGPADRVTLLTFSQYIHQRSPLTSDFASLRAEIDGVQAGGSTAWHDALFAGVEILEGSARQPLLLLFTDGEDTYSWLRTDQLPALVEESSTIVYAVTTASSSNGRPAPRSSRVRLLEQVTRVSGGRLIEVPSTEELEARFEQVLGEMRSRYILSYHPRGVERGGWHTIEVELRHRKGEIRARRGYFRQRRD